MNTQNEEIVPEEKTEDMKEERSDICAEKLERCEKERNEYLELSQRMKADLANFKKDQEKMMQSFTQYAAQDAIEKFFPVLDSIGLALKHIPKELEANGWVKGIASIKLQIDAMLKDMKVTEIPAAGAQFDPMLHEAVAQEESDEHDGKIIEELQKGYMLHGKVLRAAKVKIGHKKE